jgi:hypothetical protein
MPHGHVLGRGFANQIRRGADQVSPSAIDLSLDVQGISGHCVSQYGMMSGTAASLDTEVPSGFRRRLNAKL